MNYKLHPNWITGFIDAEGCFTLYLDKRKSKWNVKACFHLELHSRDLNLILQIKSFFDNIGFVNVYSNRVIYRVCKLDDLINVIIPHFDKYNLISQKFADFVIFKEIVKLMKNKEHLNQEF